MAAKLKSQGNVATRGKVSRPPKWETHDREMRKIPEPLKSWLMFEATGPFKVTQIAAALRKGMPAERMLRLLQEQVRADTRAMYGVNHPQSWASDPDRPLRVPAPAPAYDPGPDGKQQAVIPGAERASDAKVAERRWDEPMRPKVQQKAPAGLFGEERNQLALF